VYRNQFNMIVVDLISFEDHAASLGSKRCLEMLSNCMGSCDDVDVAVVIQAEDIAAQMFPRN